jgi:hypothetical protein
LKYKVKNVFVGQERVSMNILYTLDGLEVKEKVLVKLVEDSEV